MFTWQNNARNNNHSFENALGAVEGEGMKLLLMLVAFNVFADIAVPKFAPTIAEDIIQKTPRYSFFDGANTGIYQSGNHSIAFARQGEKVFEIKADGTLEFEKAKLNKEESTFMFMAVVKYLAEKGICK